MSKIVFYCHLLSIIVITLFVVVKLCLSPDITVM